MRESDKQMLADHYLDFYQMAYSVLHNKEDVEDVVQESLAVTMAHTWIKNPYNYCVKVLRHNCYKMLKKSDYVLVEHLPDMPVVEEGVDEKRLQTIWRLKNQLPERISKLFDLYYVKGYTHEEISEMTGTSLPMLKKLFRKRHNRLRKQLQEIENKEKD